METLQNELPRVIAKFPSTNCMSVPADREPTTIYLVVWELITISRIQLGHQLRWAIFLHSEAVHTLEDREQVIIVSHSDFDIGSITGTPIRHRDSQVKHGSEKEQWQRER